MDRSIPYIRRTARDVLAVSVGFGLGISYSLVGARADLDPIWRNDPDIPGAKVNVSPMILYALTLC